MLLAVAVWVAGVGVLMLRQGALACPQLHKGEAESGRGGGKVPQEDAALSAHCLPPAKGKGLSLPQAPPGSFMLPSLQAYCLAPFDLIKVRLQNQTEPRAQPGSPPPRYRGPVHCAASIFQAEGPRGLFRGAWALTLRDTPTMGIYFVTYEWLCRQSTPDGQNPSK